MTHILFSLPYASANTRKEAEENTYSLIFLYIGFYSSSHLTELKKNLTSTTVA